MADRLWVTTQQLISNPMREKYGSQPRRGLFIKTAVRGNTVAQWSKFKREFLKSALRPEA